MQITVEMMLGAAKAKQAAADMHVLQSTASNPDAARASLAVCTAEVAYWDKLVHDESVAQERRDHVDAVTRIAQGIRKQ